MLADLLFPTALLLVSFLFLFHGLVLLLAPDKYISTLARDQTTIRLVRKRPVQYGQRFTGFFLTAGILWIFTVPAIERILHLISAHGVSGDGNVSPGNTRWDLLAVAIGEVLLGYFMISWPKKWVEALFVRDKEKLQDPATRRIWTLYIQLAGLYFSVFSLLLFVDFAKSLR